MPTTTTTEIGDKNASMSFSGTGSATGSATTIEQGLLALGLQQYIKPCQESGVKSWAKLSQLSESDFENLGISLGHRRKLQRAFAQQNFWPDYLPLPTAKEIQGFSSFPFESESSGSEESTTPQPLTAGIPPQPTSAPAQNGGSLKLDDDTRPELEIRQRPRRPDELESS